MSGSPPQKDACINFILFRARLVGYHQYIILSIATKLHVSYHYAISTHLLQKSRPGLGPTGWIIIISTHYIIMCGNPLISHQRSGEYTWLQCTGSINASPPPTPTLNCSQSRYIHTYFVISFTKDFRLQSHQVNTEERLKKEGSRRYNIIIMWYGPFSAITHLRGNTDFFEISRKRVKTDFISLRCETRHDNYFLPFSSLVDTLFIWSRNGAGASWTASALPRTTAT